VINAWWASDAQERFWMETIRRPEHGDGIRAPHIKQNGANWPYYALVGHVRDGDVVLHWDTSGSNTESSFVAYSIVEGAPYETSDMTYNDGTPTTGMEALLTSYTALEPPLGLEVLNSRFDAIAAVRNQVAATTSPPTYFPFNIRQDRTVRAMQGGYLTKFPVALFDVLPELRPAQRAAQVQAAVAAGPDARREARARTGQSRSDRRQARESGHVADAVVRKAIENRAVQLATLLYKSLGYEVEDVGSRKAYDLHLLHATTGEERHVEVKGTTTDGVTVELTHGEVDHAANFQPTDLFVVKGITWARDGDTVVASGGTAHRHQDWCPSDESLKAIRFRHTVPLADG
jgi:hypothetical protein